MNVAASWMAAPVVRTDLNRLERVKGIELSSTLDFIGVLPIWLFFGTHFSQFLMVRYDALW